MTEERGDVADGPGPTAPAAASDPVAPLPAPVRPIGVVLGLSAIHAAGAAALVAVGAAVALEDAAALVGLWFALGVALGIPGSLALAALGWRVERALTGRRPPRGGHWLALALGAGLVAHWLPACALSPVLLGAGLLSSGYQAEQYLAGAFVALGAWFLAAIGVVLAAGAARALERRDWVGAEPLPGPSLVPTSCALGVAYGAAIAGPGVGWTAFLDEAWRSGQGLVPALVWVLLGLAAAAFAGGVTGAWLRRAAPHAPGIAVGARNLQVEAAGAVLAAHWAAPFAIGLGPVSGTPDLQWALLGLSGGAILLGTTLWSGSRTLRVEAARAVP